MMEEMSPKRDRTVREMVEKYRSQFPMLERPMLRTLIRREHKDIFIPESGKLKTLDRELRKSFKLTPYSFVSIDSNDLPERWRDNFELDLAFLEHEIRSDGKKVNKYVERAEILKQMIKKSEKEKTYKSNSN
jgi:hypothetical protein